MSRKASGETAPTTVSEMLDRVEAGTMTTEQATQWVREHRWPPARTHQAPRNAAEHAKLMARDPEPFRPGAITEVYVAYMSHRIDLDTYAALTEAYTEVQHRERPVLVNPPASKSEE